jgi:hypothetical protein
MIFIVFRGDLARMEEGGRQEWRKAVGRKVHQGARPTQIRARRIPRLSQIPGPRVI